MSASMIPDSGGGVLEEKDANLGVVEVPRQKALSVDLYEEHAREKAGMPAEWKLFKWECFPKTGEPGEVLYVEVTGAVALQKFAKGARKGQMNWSKRSSERTVVLPVNEHETWCDAWERRTGLCQRCTGTGRVFSGWNHITGSRFVTCRKCGGTGAASEKEEKQDEV